MDGVHDLGGLDGFGPVATADGHLVAHEPWEMRAQMLALVSGLGSRDGIERLDPATYLASGYYERWLRAAEAAAVDRGLLTAQDLDDWRTRFAADPDRAVPTASNPDVVAIIRTLGPHTHGAVVRPAFPIGAPVRVRRMRPEEHHRCPRYLRGATGEVEAVLGDDPVPGLSGGSETSETCYTIRFEAAELFGGAVVASGSHVVLVDLWERYLEGAS